MEQDTASSQSMSSDVMALLQSLNAKMEAMNAQMVTRDNLTTNNSRIHSLVERSVTANNDKVFSIFAHRLGLKKEVFDADFKLLEELALEDVDMSDYGRVLAKYAPAVDKTPDNSPVNSILSEDRELPRDESQQQPSLTLGSGITLSRRRDSFMLSQLPETPAAIKDTKTVHFDNNRLSGDDTHDFNGDLGTIGAQLDSAFLRKATSNPLVDPPPGSAYNKRLSPLDRQINAADKVVEAYHPTFFKPEPAHSIQLSSLTLSSIIKFVDETLDYQNRYEVKLRVGTLIKPDIAQELCGRFDTLTVPQLLNLSAQEVFQLLQLEIAPTTSYEFFNRMNATVHFELAASRQYRPSPSDFRPFYTALLRYKKVFLRAYDILVRYATTRVAPPFNTKKYGLIRLFLDKVPFDYGDRLHQAELEHRLGHNGDIKTIYNYVSQFYTIVERHFETYRQVRIMGQLFGGSFFHAGTNSTKPPVSHFRSDKPNHRLNAIPEIMHSSDEEHDMVSAESHDVVYVTPFDHPETDDSKDDANAYSDEYMDDVIMSDIYEDHSSQELVRENPLVTDTETHDLNAFATQPSSYNNTRSNSVPTSQKPRVLVCRLTILAKDGRCPLIAAGKPCTMSHDPQLLREAYQTFRKQLSESHYATSPSSGSFPPRVSVAPKDNTDKKYVLTRRPPPPPQSRA